MLLKVVILQSLYRVIVLGMKPVYISQAFNHEPD